jgi:hypothetical protein
LRKWQLIQKSAGCTDMELGGGCSGSTIVGVGDSEPPQFIYDEEQYRDTFISGLHIISLFCFSVTVAAVPSKSVRCQLVSCVIDVVAPSPGQPFLFPRNFNEFMYLLRPSTLQVLSMMCKNVCTWLRASILLFLNGIYGPGKYDAIYGRVLCRALC